MVQLVAELEAMALFLSFPPLLPAVVGVVLQTAQTVQQGGLAAGGPILLGPEEQAILAGIAPLKDMLGGLATALTFPVVAVAARVALVSAGPQLVMAALAFKRLSRALPLIMLVVAVGQDVQAPPEPEGRGVVAVVRRALMEALRRLLVPLIRVVAGAVVLVRVRLLGMVRQVVLALSSFAIRTFIPLRLPLLVHQPLLFQVGIGLINGPLVVQSRSEERHGAFCRT